MRMFSIFLSFYIAFGIVQIPFVQNIMPDYIKEIMEEPTVLESHYLSIIVPNKDFNPANDVYQDGLQPMGRREVTEALLNSPQISEEGPDDFTFNGETIASTVYLYAGSNDDEIFEIEFSVPADQLEAADEVVEVMVEIASEIPGSMIYDYNQTKLFDPGNPTELVNSLKNVGNSQTE